MNQEFRNALPVPGELQEYRLERILGAGGFGITYLALDVNLNQRVAIKEYLPAELAVREGTLVHPKTNGDVPTFEWGLERFLLEAQTLARFNHPNIVQVFRFFREHNTAYMVMRYEEGESLKQAIRNRTDLDEVWLRHLLDPLLDGLEKVHAAGFLHRDIKPDNIYLRQSDGSPVLLDFGAARQAMGDRSKSLTAVVTPGYAPYEQYQSSGDQGPWSDLYALGAVVYRVVVGRVPVDATLRVGARIRGTSDPLSLAVDLGRGRWSLSLLQAVDHALAVVEGDRPRSIAQWRRELNGEVVATPPSLPPANPGEEGGATLVADPLPTRHRSVIAESLPAEGIRSGSGGAAGVAKAGRSWRRWVVVLVLVAVVVALVVGAKGVVKARRQEQKAAVAPAAAKELAVVQESSTPATRDPLQNLRQAAEEGGAAARFKLGLRLEHGQGVAKDEAAAARWYRLAADQGHGEARLRLGLMVEEGRGVPRDEQEGLGLIRQGAEQGHARSQLVWGIRMSKGQGLPRDEAQALQWFRKAAEQGLPEAQTLLGVQYSQGRGVDQDQTMSYYWLSQAVNQGHREAEKPRERIAKRMGPEWVAETDRMVKDRPIRWRSEEPR